MISRIRAELIFSDDALKVQVTHAFKKLNARTFHMVGIS